MTHETPDEAATRIARRYLSIRTLESRGNDSDFYEVGVWSLAEALRAAYEAGRASVKAPPDKPLAVVARSPEEAVDVLRSSGIAASLESFSGQDMVGRIYTPCGAVVSLYHKGSALIQGPEGCRRSDIASVLRSLGWEVSP